MHSCGEDEMLTRVPNDQRIRGEMKKSIQRAGDFDSNFMGGCEARVCKQHIISEKASHHNHMRAVFKLKELGEDALWSAAVNAFEAMVEHGGPLPQAYPLFATSRRIHVSIALCLKCSNDPSRST